MLKINLAKNLLIFFLNRPWIAYKNYLTNLDNINLNYVSSYNIFVNKNLTNSYLNYNNLKLDYIKCVFNLNYNLYTINYYYLNSFYIINYLNLYNYINLKQPMNENPYSFLFSQKKFNLLPENSSRLVSKLHILKKDLNFKFILFALLFKSSNFLSEYIANSIRFKKFRDLQVFFNSLISNTSLLLNILKVNRVKLKGIRIDCSGRFNGIDRTRTISIKQGILSFNQIDSNILYSFNTSYTKYGSFGIKV